VLCSAALSAAAVLPLAQAPGMHSKKSARARGGFCRAHSKFRFLSHGCLCSIFFTAPSFEHKIECVGQCCTLSGKPENSNQPQKICFVGVAATIEVRFYVGSIVN